MRRDTRHRLFLTQREVINALKVAYPNNIYVQAIPETPSDRVTTPQASTTATGLEITWTVSAPDPQ